MKFFEVILFASAPPPEGGTPNLHRLLNLGLQFAATGERRWTAVCGVPESHFQAIGSEIKDLDRGLIDFPAIIGGKEVFLCWEQDDEDVDFWHDLPSGNAGRERL